MTKPCLVKRGKQYAVKYFNEEKRRWTHQSLGTSKRAIADQRIGGFIKDLHKKEFLGEVGVEPIALSRLAARGRTRKDGFPTVGAVCDRPYFVISRKNARSQTAPTIDTANSAVALGSAPCRAPLPPLVFRVYNCGPRGRQFEP